MNGIFVTGIGTGVGKTVVSAVLSKALGADYWKPIQAGNLDDSDSMTVRRLTDATCTIHPEAVRLKAAMSPHAAARLEQVHVRINELAAPKSSRTLIIEGAGGLMVPINDEELMVDLISNLAVPVVLVASVYLGSINHTLLSIDRIRQLEVPFGGVIFSGDSNVETERVISRFAPVIGHVRKLHVLNSESIGREAAALHHHSFWKSFAR